MRRRHNRRGTCALLDFTLGLALVSGAGCFGGGGSGAGTGTGTGAGAGAPNGAGSGGIGGGASPSGGIDVLEGATPFTAPEASLVEVTYTDVTGESLTMLAYAGQTFAIVDPAVMDESAVEEMASVNRASVLAAIPVAGEYWFSVGDGNEASFLESIMTHPGVRLAMPNIPTAVAADPVDLSGATSLTPLSLGDRPVAQMDDFRGGGSCGSHGAQVGKFLAAGGQEVAAYDIGAKGADLAVGLARAAIGAEQDRRRLVVNVSLQSAAEPNDGKNRAGCPDPGSTACTSGTCGGAPGHPCAGSYPAWKKAQYGFLSEIASLLQHMGPRVRSNTLVVVSAGNAGMDLKNEIEQLRKVYPDGFSHMLLVGSTGATMSAAHNHSSNPADMIYAKGFGVMVPGQASCIVNGTSFAAPQVAELAARLSRQFPTLTMDEIARAIDQAAPRDTSGRRAIPDFDAAARIAAAISNGTGVPPRDAGPPDADVPDATSWDATVILDGGPAPDASNACCGCTFDVYCTVYGPGGCWYCNEGTYSGDACSATGDLIAPGPCSCDPSLYYVCQ